MSTTSVTIGSSVITGIAGYSLKYFLDRKQASASAGANFKRKMYQGYVESILLFYQNPSAANEQEEAERTQRFANETRDFQKLFVLDASPAVIRAIKRQHMYFKKCNDRGLSVDARKAQRKNARVFKMMRRDIGTNNWGLGLSAGIIFSPVNMYPYEQVMHPLWWRVKKIMRKIYTKVTAPVTSRLQKIKTKIYDWVENL